MEGFLDSIRKQFESYKSLGDKTFEQLDEKDFSYRPNENSNSIAMIVRHVSGNLKSRFTDFLTSDGEKPWRNRDEEFEDYTASKSQVIYIWTDGWNALFNTLDQLKTDDLEKEITIRQQPAKVYDALLRSLAHTASHVGQIMYIGKSIRDAGWKSLSIPKSKSHS